MSGSTPVSLPGLGDIDVWWIDLDRIEDDSPSVLAHDERVRAERFKSPRDRARWISARVALRQILTGYTGTMSAQLLLTQGTHGKPALAGEPSLRFNLAMPRSGPYWRSPGTARSESTWRRSTRASM